MVLEARFVSSCLIFPSSAMPRLSRLLASRGSSVSVLVRVLFGGTFSLEEEQERRTYDRQPWEVRFAVEHFPGSKFLMD
jgi:hypothetical protein